MQILAGEADVMIAGGTEAPLVGAVIEPFREAGILAHHEDPRRACRPFDVSRNGMLLGEGAAFLVLETEELARRRGAEPIARLLGWAMTADAHGRTSPRNDAAGLIRAMIGAMRRARISPEAVDYINLHGTGTVLNDRVEALALRHVFGSQTKNVPGSSTKPVTGHCLGATPALEAVVAIQSLLHQEMPPTINHEQPDKSCAWDVVPQHSRPARLETVLSISQGFWGNNAALVFGRA
jgi:3-oxoacyl-[acyl-carrier-protein] synthase II